ncbi:hypothetical protein EBU71_10930 [bacterium]|nr:hypothetical protein [Candidatus Elulimicrobium humile]
MFAIGGTDFYLHKYLGVNTAPENATADQPHYDVLKETNIQDLLLLENRDRKYDPSIYKIRGHYQVQNLDFNLSQFGLFIDNDTIFATVHINDWIRTVGRKPLSGDVFELPHLKDEFALNDYVLALPRYFVIEDVSRASEGFSQTWWPHLYRIKLKKIMDAQAFADILDQPAGENTNQTLRDLLSSKGQELQINNAILEQAEADAPLSGYETRQFFTLAIDPETGNPTIETADQTDIDASITGLDTSRINGRATRPGYLGHLTGDGFPPNGYEFGHGINFPINPYLNDYFLRTDFMPNRLFRYDGKRWVKSEDAVRHTLTNTDNRRTHRFGFINNQNINTINGEEIIERQAISKILKPKADL